MEIKSLTNYVPIIIITLLCGTKLQSQQQEDTLLTYFNQLVNKGTYRTLIEEYRLVSNPYNKINKGEYLNLYANAFQNLNQADSAFYYYKEALKDFENRHLLEKVAETNLMISDLLESQNNLESNHYSYFKKF